MPMSNIESKLYAYSLNLELKQDYGLFVIAAGYDSAFFNELSGRDCYNLGHTIQQRIKTLRLRDCFDGNMVTSEGVLRVLKSLAPEQKNDLRDSIAFVPEQKHVARPR
jgi:hypothetical protein